MKTTTPTAAGTERALLFSALLRFDRGRHLGRPGGGAEAEATPTPGILLSIAAVSSSKYCRRRVGSEKRTLETVGEVVTRTRAAASSNVTER